MQLNKLNITLEAFINNFNHTHTHTHTHTHRERERDTHTHTNQGETPVSWRAMVWWTIPCQITVTNFTQQTRVLSVCRLLTN